MKIKILKPAELVGQPLLIAGDEMEVDNETAEMLIDRGIAEVIEVTEKPKKSKKNNT